MGMNRLELKIRRLRSLQKTQEIVTNNIISLYEKIAEDKTPTKRKLDVEEDIQTGCELLEDFTSTIAKTLKELEGL